MWLACCHRRPGAHRVRIVRCALCVLCVRKRCPNATTARAAPPFMFHSFDRRAVASCPRGMNGDRQKRTRVARRGRWERDSCGGERHGVASLRFCCSCPGLCRVRKAPCAGFEVPLLQCESLPLIVREAMMGTLCRPGEHETDGSRRARNCS